MSIGLAQSLLSRLAGLARPDSVPDRAVPAVAPIEGRSFKELLDQAGSGVIKSGLPVRVAEGSGLSLTKDQLSRLESAADAADAAGAHRALVLIDGVALEMDVQSRTIVSKLDAAAPGVKSGFDTVLTVPGPAGAPGSPSAGAGPLGPPPSPPGGLAAILSPPSRA
jgi:hypothetical protein